MSAIHPALVERAHGYTQSDEPWRMDADMRACGETSRGRRFSWRLFHYLSGGGMKCLGRNIRQEERESRQRRFFVGMGLLGALWLVLWIF